MLQGMKELAYPDRLYKLKLPNLVYRRLRGDMIEMFKILTGKYDSELEVIIFVRLSDQAPNTRSHFLKVAKFRPNTTQRKFSFITRCTDTWDNLPDEMIAAPSINNFKNRLDKLWRTLPLLYNHEDNPTPKDLSRPTYTHHYQAVVRDMIAQEPTEEAP